MSNDREFLASKIFPALDAVSSNLLNDLKPGSMTDQGSYTLTCPACGKKDRAYYFPGGPITCHRLNECKDGASGVSVWTFLKSEGYSNKEIFKKLCDAVGQYPDETKATKNPSSVFKSVTNYAFKTTEPAVQKFLSDRKLTPEEITQINLGFYPSTNYIRKALINNGISELDAMNLGYIPKSSITHNEKQNNAELMNGRVIGYWEQENGDLGYWGYKKDAQPKYLFSSQIKKTKPYKFYSSHSVNIVEGTLDADSMILCGYRCMAIGQAGLSSKQAEYLASQGIKHVNHIIDTDTAGFIGGLRTIHNAYAADLTASITFLGFESDDPDNLRRIGRLDILREKMDKTIEPSMFAALLYAKSCKEAPGFDLRKEILLKIKDLPPAYTDMFNEHLNLLGFKK